MVVMGTRPMAIKIMWRRVVDQPLFHLANGRQSIVIYGLFVGGTDLPFSKTSISKAWPALVGSKHHRGSAVVCAGADADALHVSSKVDGRSVIFCISLFERHDVQAHHPGRSLAVGPIDPRVLIR